MRATGTIRDFEVQNLACCLLHQPAMKGEAEWPAWSRPLEEDQPRSRDGGDAQAEMASAAMCAA